MRILNIFFFLIHFNFRLIMVDQTDEAHTLIRFHTIYCSEMHSGPLLQVSTRLRSLQTVSRRISNPVAGGLAQNKRIKILSFYTCYRVLCITVLYTTDFEWLMREFSFQIYQRCLSECQLRIKILLLNFESD